MNFFGKGVGHKIYTFENGYKNYHQVKIVPKDQLKTTFTTPWGTFCYIVMSFGLYNAPGTFPCLMNKVFETFLGLSLWVSIDDCGFYSHRTSHLAIFKYNFQCFDGSKVTLSPKKTTIDFSKGRWLGTLCQKMG